MMVGIDIVEISEFKRRLEKGDLQNIFLPIELSQNVKAESLAGVFAAKEAFFKALGEKHAWTDVWIEKDSTGKPILSSPLLSLSQKTNISISHAGNYAIAIAYLEQ